MNRKFLVLLMIPLLSVTSLESNDKFVGKWIGEDNDDIGYIVFEEEGYATLGLSGQVIGGKEFIMKGEKGSMTYVINDAVSPIELDLIVTKLNSGEQKSLLCIVEFRSEFEMEFAISFNDQRPVEFTEDNSIILTKSKE